MVKVNCVRCGHEVEINITQAKDEEGEVFECPHCGLNFRYCDK